MYYKIQKIQWTKGKIFFGIILLIILYLVLTDSNLFVKREVKTTTKQIDFQTETKLDSTLPTGFSYVKTPGQNGIERIDTEYTYKKDGNLLSQKIINQKETSQPVTKIIVQGNASLDTFSKELRKKAQSFYDKYKNGEYIGAEKYLEYVSGHPSLPYTDNTIKQAIKDTGFSIKEITIGQPTVQVPSAYSWMNTTTEVTADIPYQVTSSDSLHSEQVFEFNKTAYFDTKTHAWLFSPIGAIFSTPETVSRHFDGLSANNSSISGTLQVTKVILAIPMSNNWGSADQTLSLEVLYNGTFDNGTQIKEIEINDVRDDLGNTYASATNATPFSGSDNNQTDIGTVWNTISVDPKKIIGAKKISFGIYHVSDNLTNTYSFFGNNGTDSYPKDFTLTDILLH